MNERTYEKTGGYAALASNLTRFAAELTTLPDVYLEAAPLAAE